MKKRSWLTLVCAGLLLPGCASVGTSALSGGRGAYNEVINRTHDEQVLSLIVRKRYDETFGMLAVSSVTASMKFNVSIGANAGVGPRSGYEGNLVPLSAGAEYEENPTISYTPMRGEQFVERMLAPLSAEQTLLLSRMSTDRVEVLRFLIRRANGLTNPLYSSRPASDAFDRFVVAYAELRERGKLDVVGSETGAVDGGRLEMLIHDCTSDDAPVAREMLATLGLEAPPNLGSSVFPLRFLVGSPRTRGVDLETASAMDVIEAAAAGVEVPPADLAAGVARDAHADRRNGLVTVHSSTTKPENAAVAVRHGERWFFIDARDAASKQGFIILRTLIGMRLDDSRPGQSVPVLTVPVGG
jgi:hypothetical protein